MLLLVPASFIQCRIILFPVLYFHFNAHGCAEEIDNRLSPRTDFSLFLFHSEKIWDRDESPCNRGVHIKEGTSIARTRSSFLLVLVVRRFSSTIDFLSSGAEKDQLDYILAKNFPLVSWCFRSVSVCTSHGFYLFLC